MFRVPPSPFNLKKPFSPTGNRPLKIQSRRLSNTSDERASPIATTLDTHVEEIVRESEVEDVDTHDRSGTSTVARSDKRSSAKKHKGDTTLSEDAHTVKDSFVAAGNGNGEEHLIEDSFLQQLRTYPVVTPPQTTNKRKRHEHSSQHDKSSSKHKRSRKSNEPEISFDLPNTSINTSNPGNANSSQMTDLPEQEEPSVDEQSQQMSKKQRKEERRKRKEERKKEKKERKKRKIESTGSDAVNPLDHDRVRDDSPTMNPIKEVRATQEEPAQTANAASQQESSAIELDEDSLDLGRPAVPRNRRKVLEIPATQNPQPQPNPSPSNPSEVQSPPEEQANEQPPSLPQQQNPPNKPPPKVTKRKRLAPSKASPKTSRKLISNEKILDSSASDEEPDPEPKPKSKTKTPRKPPPKPKPAEQELLRSTSPDAEPRSKVQNVALGRFTLEEDKRLLRVAKAYRVVRSPFYKSS